MPIHSIWWLIDIFVKLKRQDECERKGKREIEMVGRERLDKQINRWAW